jgi:hypothetical protein
MRSTGPLISSRRSPGQLAPMVDYFHRLEECMAEQGFDESDGLRF